MKRLNSSDSLGALFSMCPSSDNHSPTPRNNICSRDYQCMLDGLDEDGCIEESGHVPEKKRRLSVDQVKALEKNFEVENKLEPERKVKLAQELGLQPRQVAVWFQNRRARWKTKQLERDYGVLKSSFDSLKLNYESLQQDKDALLKEIKELKAKLNSESNKSIIKEEISQFESDHINEIDIEPITPPESMSDGSENVKLIKVKNAFAEFKDGSDSDSSEIFQTQQLIMSPNSSSPPSSINGLSFSDSRSDGLGTTQKIFDHPHFVKIEEHNFFSGEEACNFFSEEQAPSLPWYCPDQWS